MTSLCPCSKEISNYGAHNQRSHVTVSVRSSAFIWIEELIETVEAQASCELYGLLKRPDEKYVTEKAYDNPKFVEDLVRDIAGQLNQDKRISGYTVEAEKFRIDPQSFRLRADPLRTFKTEQHLAEFLVKFSGGLAE